MNDRQISKNKIIFGAGKRGKTLLGLLGFDNVAYFCDNDTAKCGQVYCKKEVISFDRLCEIYSDYDVVISVSGQAYNEIKLLCQSANIFTHKYDDFTRHFTLPQYRKLLKFKDNHKDKRCFIIGNGPSLSMKDLDKLTNEITFAANFIGRAFDQTDWRPKYYSVSDIVVYRELDMVLNMNAEYIFLPDPIYKFGEEYEFIKDKFKNKKENVYFFRLLPGINKGVVFSDDLSRGIYAYNGIITNFIQMAIYMGISEIYLLGCDTTIPIVSDAKSYIADKSHFYEENEEDYTRIVGNSYAGIPEYFNMLITDYKKIKAYAAHRNVSIFNATRGGNLEVFNRVDFDSLF